MFSGLSAHGQKSKMGLLIRTGSMSGVDNEPGNKELEHKMEKGLEEMNCPIGGIGGSFLEEAAMEQMLGTALSTMLSSWLA